MHTRAVEATDIPRITSLEVRVEQAIGGTEVVSEAEVAEQLEMVEDLATASLVVEDDDGALLGASWRWGTTTWWLVDPDVEGDAVHHLLLGWLEEGPIRIADADSRDAQSLAVLAERGWQHAHSSFDLEMDLERAAALDEPAWAEGVAPIPWDPARAEDVHDLIYVRSAWAAVPGHEDRPLEEWRGLFAGNFLVADQQVLAEEDGALVGAAMCRIWDDGTGWVSQLAVAVEHRGRGLGRALLLQALRGLRDGGAEVLGLSVNAENRGALGLYQRVGLEIQREWLTHEFPTTP